mmetsp:Transcript_148058/g.258260  ORF Transcript_148058/g.258260 Transcript_148058/m.258260 type:complete len:213 (-) Transcript_148058:36-674(-)
MVQGKLERECVYLFAHRPVAEHSAQILELGPQFADVVAAEPLHAAAELLPREDAHLLSTAVVGHGQGHGIQSADAKISTKLLDAFRTDAVLIWGLVLPEEDVKFLGVDSGSGWLRMERMALGEKGVHSLVQRPTVALQKFSGQLRGSASDGLEVSHLLTLRAVHRRHLRRSWSVPRVCALTVRVLGWRARTATSRRGARCDAFGSNAAAPYL